MGVNCNHVIRWKNVLASHVFPTNNVIEQLVAQELSIGLIQKTRWKSSELSSLSDLALPLKISNWL